MANKEFDVVVIGSGPGGYPAAIKAAQEGKSVALIEAGDLGGTCLNRGCIPSKALIACADALNHVKKAEEFGISVENVSFDYAKMVDRKDLIVQKVRKSLEGLIKSNGITLLKGYGKFTSPNTIKISGEDSQEIQAEKVIIATGSEPRDMPEFPCDHKRILDSTSMLEVRELPKKLVIIGGGVIGCEFANLYNAFGVDVTILEVMDRIIPMECTSVSHHLEKSFRKQGIKIETNVLVQGIDNTGKGVNIKVSGDRNIEADMALVAVGRVLNTPDIGLETTGVKVDDRGQIVVNEKMETNISGIYAIGDIASRWWLAHVASHQGLVAAKNAVGLSAEMHYNAVPSVIFTNPEVATVGMTLEKAIEEGHRATIGSFPFQALGKAQASLHTEGFAQVVVDRETHQVLGAQVVGHEAATLVAEMAIVIANEMTIECVTETIHAHPTIAEAWLEASYVAQEKPLHLPPSRKAATAR